MKAVLTSVMRGIFSLLLVRIKQPNYLYDIHVSVFSLILGVGMIVNEINPGPHADAWGCVVLLLGICRLLAISMPSMRLHSASCLLSSMGWIFLACIFYGNQHYIMALIFCDFSFSSFLRYTQLVWWSIGPIGEQNGQR